MLSSPHNCFSDMSPTPLYFPMWYLGGVRARALFGQGGKGRAAKSLCQSQAGAEEISGLIKKLYEAYATGKIPENHFSELLTGYDNEQKTLDGEIERLQAEIDRYNTDSVRADKFIELVKRHTEFTEFSASLLNEFVEKIIVHEAAKVNGVREQEVEIYLNFIGKFDLPEPNRRNSRRKRR